MKTITLLLAIGLMFILVCGQFNGASPTLQNLLAIVLNPGNESDKKRDIIGVIDSPDASQMLRNMSIDPILAKAVVESTNLTILFTKTINMGALVTALTAKDKTKAIVNSVDWCQLDEAVNFEMLLRYPNVSEVIGKSLGINPYLLKVFFNQTDIDRLYSSIDIKKIVEILTSANVTVNERNSKIIAALDVNEIVESMEWMNNNEDVTTALEEAGVNGTALQMIKFIGVQNILQSIDTKALLDALVNGKEITMEFMTENMKWGILVQHLLGANTTVNVTSECGTAFKDMLLPLPDFSNGIDLTKVDSILMLQHPIMQCK